MEILTELQKSLVFVAQSDYFYQAMAAVTIVGMLIGSMLYNGDLNQLKKATLTIFAYGSLIAMTNVARIISSEAGVTRNLMHQGQAFNGTTTIVYVTFFYLIGVVVGVFIHRGVRKEKLNN